MRGGAACLWIALARNSEDVTRPPVTNGMGFRKPIGTGKPERPEPRAGEVAGWQAGSAGAGEQSLHPRHHAGGTERQVTFDGAEASYYVVTRDSWSPDSAMLAVCARDAGRGAVCQLCRELTGRAAAADPDRAVLPEAGRQVDDRATGADRCGDWAAIDSSIASCSRMRISSQTRNGGRTDAASTSGTTSAGIRPIASSR